ncbi:phosphocarrier protein [Methylohalomonas lacus]|uniref:Phosphocarrier protein n=1 Tax=Methylohalomonas lacus TaxID=398773 RepID=A0AAE3HN67_9GAMM|nr:HPr family phosphocarrier protein [Methylohalomonas lacus]MCS3904214.1 phosphocarrier protein [Methylohalomonas lacus]
MTEKTQINIVNKLGLHARAAARFVQTASEYQSEITLIHNGRRVSGKSIMGVMMLAAGKGSCIEIEADGNDAEAALEALTELTENRFGESE